MSISYSILGKPGRDNALLVQVDSGQTVHRLLFDCGDGCLSGLSFSDIKAIDHLFFSHLHMDHIGGFDNYIRCNYNREFKPNLIWGPPETSAIIQHRLQGFLWNLFEGEPGSWLVSDVHPNQLRTTRFELDQAFAVAHDEETRSHENIIWDSPDFFVQTLTMDHLTPSLAYVVREKPRQNIDTDRMTAMGLPPGPWLNQLKDLTNNSATIDVGGQSHSLPRLRDALIRHTPGDSVAYLTDFLLDGQATDRLAEALKGCRSIICESQYRHKDLDLAQNHHHLTSVQAAELAKRAEVEKMVLFHLSDRYDRNDWGELLREAREIFPDTCFPEHWELNDDKTR